MAHREGIQADIRRGKLRFILLYNHNLNERKTNFPKLSPIPFFHFLIDKILLITERYVAAL